MQILVFGDSIAFGMWDEEGGWVERLKKVAQGKSINSHKENTDFYLPIFNLGNPGERSAGLVKRLEGEIIGRLNSEQENVIIFAIGINDTQIVNNSHQEIPLEDFKRNLREIF